MPGSELCPDSSLDLPPYLRQVGFWRHFWALYLVAVPGGCSFKYSLVGDTPAWSGGSIWLCPVARHCSIGAVSG